MTRKNCETNWAELAVAAFFDDPTVKTVDDLRNCQLAKVNPNYVNDLEGRKPERVKLYLSNLRKQLANFNFGKVDRVVVLGKNQTVDPEVSEIQKGLDRKQTKADVMVKFVDGRWIGVSVKDSFGATLTNYSVEKLLPTGMKLAQIRLRVQEDAGLPVNKQDKELRSKYNACFKIENDYFNAVEKEMEKNCEEVLDTWVTSMYPANMPFDLFLFNGVTFTQINKEVDTADVQFTRISNPAKRSRGAAKMFYSVTVENKVTYRWEIRWKGNTLQSPQILTHAVH